MINVIDDADGVSKELGERRFQGELEEDFACALARVKMAPRRLPFGRRLKRLMMRLGLGRLRPRTDELTSTERHVAFDGFRTSMYDEKTERDRRYGTIYTVSEEANAYIIRLEFPRVVPNSSLKRMWNLRDEMPDYDYTISLDDGVLTIRAGVRGEAYRRLSYISASFPSDFMTRIQLAKAVAGFKHRLRDKVLEIIIFKAAGGGIRRAA
ncbi:MAG: Hsp20/alpha crystallin family protein [Candidatus Binataceae bacterium]